MKKFILFSISAYLLLISVVPACFGYTLKVMQPTDILANSQQDLKDNFNGIIAGTADSAGTGLDTWDLGDGGDTNKSLRAGNDDADKSFIRYIATQDNWAFSNNGTYVNYFVAATSDIGAFGIGIAKSSWAETNKYCFEGATANAFESCITVTDPTADRTFTIPNEDADLINYNDSKIKGWVNFNGSGTVAIRDSFNVSSIADIAVGEYQVVWDVDFASINYSAIGMAGLTADTAYIVAHQGSTSIAAGYTQIIVSDHANARADATLITVIAIGDQ